MLNKKSSYLLLLVAFMCISLPESLFASAGNENFVLKGRIADLADHPVEGAEVYVFDSQNVKRPADYISNRTGKDGLFRVELPQGNYWLVAIARKSDRKFGPLTRNDRHSGEPIELSSQGKNEQYIDFTVLDLQEAARRNRKENERLIKISGQVLDRNGKAVPMAFVMADKKKNYGKMPFYFSAWTDREGRYVIYVPPGPIYVDAATHFPPDPGRSLNSAMNFAQDTSGIDLVMVDR